MPSVFLLLSRKFEKFEIGLLVYVYQRNEKKDTKAKLLTSNKFDFKCEKLLGNI